VRKMIDLTGQKFGPNLTVVRQVPKPEGKKAHCVWWEVQCACGRTAVVRSGNLRTGNRYWCSSSCELRKMFKLHDRYFRLEIIGEAKRTKRSRVIIARCDCGTTKNIPAYHWGKIRSCGCYQDDTKHNRKPKLALPQGEAARRNVIHSYKVGAKTRGLEFALTDEHLNCLFQDNCHYCGSSPSFVRRGRGGYGDYTYNGMDRLDNSKGYVEDNVVSCCFICNRAKLDLPLDQFLAWVKRLSHHQRGAAA